MKNWFYAVENEKQGPVGKNKLIDLIEEKVVKGDDLVWSQGMDGWKKAKEVTSLQSIFKKPASSHTNSRTVEEEESFFSIEGRLRRKDYFIRVILLAIPSAFMNLISQGSNDPGVLFVASITMLICVVLIAIQAVKRLHDINMSGWYWLVFLIPLVNFIFGLYVVFKDGTAGPNEYGPDPKSRA